jgi:uncharacterized YccA/Bax inhibitor family protein
MKARAANWLSFSLALVGSLIAIVGIAGLLNLTGDCAPEVTNCGEPQRHASFVVLGLGVVWLVYLVIRFVRSPSTFR